MMRALKAFVDRGWWFLPLAATWMAGIVLAAETPGDDALSEELKWLQEETRVWSASKFEQKISDAPSLVTIITADRIRKFGYRNLMDALEGVSGIYGTYNRNYQFIGVRGFGRPGDLNTRVLLLVDGHRINDNIYEQAYVGNDFPLDIDLVERIEVARGPGSCLYGTNSFFGVINVITRQGRDVKGVEASGEYGTDDAFKGRIAYGNQYDNGLEVLVSGTRYQSPGADTYYPEFDAPETNDGMAVNQDGEDFEHLFLKTSLAGFTLSALYGSREKDVPTAPYGQPFNVRFTTVDERSYVELKYDLDLADGMKLSSRLYYDRYVYEGYYPYESDEEGRVRYNRDDDLSEWMGGEFRFTGRLFSFNTYTIGVEYLYNRHQDLLNFDADPHEVYLDDHRTSTLWAVYAQNEMRLGSQVILNFGIRHDHYESFGGTTNPRLALIWHPLDGTDLKLIYGTAFRAPDVYEERINESALGGSSGPDPEEITTYEATLEQKIGDSAHGYVSVFYNEIEGLISQVPYGDEWIFENVNDIEAKGVEVGIRGKLAERLTAGLNYTWQDVTDKDTGEWLDNSPRHMVKASLETPLIRDRCFWTLEGRWMSERETLAGEESDDVLLFNSTLYWKNILERMDASLSVYNLLDEDYGDPGSEDHAQDLIERDGRSFRFKLTMRF